MARLRCGCVDDASASRQNFSLFFSDLQTSHTHFIAGYFINILQAERLKISKKRLKKLEVIFQMALSLLQLPNVSDNRSVNFHTTILCSYVPLARAARLFFLVQPIILLVVPKCVPHVQDV